MKPFEPTDVDVECAQMVYTVTRCDMRLALTVGAAPETARLRAQLAAAQADVERLRTALTATAATPCPKCSANHAIRNTTTDKAKDTNANR